MAPALHIALDVLTVISDKLLDHLVEALVATAVATAVTRWRRGSR